MSQSLLTSVQILIHWESLSLPSCIPPQNSDSVHTTHVATNLVSPPRRQSCLPTRCWSSWKQSLCLLLTLPQDLQRGCPLPPSSPRLLLTPLRIQPSLQPSQVSLCLSHLPTFTLGAAILPTCLSKS